jgi:DNA-binding PadR family transcriptional regulator
VSTQVVEGEVRKYYCTMDQGHCLLEEILPKLREIVSEVQEGQGSSSLPEPVGEETVPPRVDEQSHHEERKDGS